MPIDTEVPVGDTPIALADGGQSEPDSGAPPQRDITATGSEILSFIGSHTQPAGCPKQWAFLGQSPTVRQSSYDEHELSKELFVKFGEDTLVATRVASRNHEGRIKLSRVFGEDKQSKFILIYDGNDQPVDAMSARGILSSSDPPCLLTTHAGPRLILASTDDDLQVLHRLGIPCTSAAGLGQLSGGHIRNLIAKSANEHRCMLTLAGWQIANLVNQPSPFFKQIISRLSRAEKIYGFKTARIFDVWSPTATEFEDIESALSFSDEGRVRELITESLKAAKMTPTESQNKALGNAEVDLPKARAEFLGAISHSQDIPRPTELRVAAERLRRRFESAVIDKFYAEAAATSDPLVTLKMLQAAELAEHFFGTSELAAAAKRAADGEYPNYNAIMDNPALEARLRLVDTILKLERSLRHKQ